MDSARGNPNGYPTRDWSKKKAAADMAAMIKAYWASRGYITDARLVENGHADYGARHDIRSDMVGGMPRRRLTA